MKRTKIIGLICIIIITSFTATTVFSQVFSEKVYGEQLILQMFEKSNANINETNSYTSLYLEGTYFEMEHMKGILDEAITHFDFENKIEEIVEFEYIIGVPEEEHIDYNENTLYITKISEIGLNKIIANYCDQDRNLSTFIIYSYEYEGKSESYIIIDILQNKRYKDMVSLLGKSKEFLLKYGEDINTTLTIVGTYDGKLSNSDSYKIMKKLLRNIDGKIVEEVEDEFYTSITAYTPYLDEAIQFFDKNINLHMAIRYNAYKDLTYIWIATPLITTTY